MAEQDFELTDFKRDELAKCRICGKGMMHDGLIFFYRVKVEQFVIDPKAVTRAMGLELLVGDASIAHALGPDENLARGMGEVSTLVCADHLSFIANVWGDD